MSVGGGVGDEVAVAEGVALGGAVTVTGAAVGEAGSTGCGAQAASKMRKAETMMSREYGGI
jgi:hypothetical protein